MSLVRSFLCFFFFNDTATTEIYTLSLHDALPICIPADNPFYGSASSENRAIWATGLRNPFTFTFKPGDRKSTRLNSSHSQISYAVFCLKKKKNPVRHPTYPLPPRNYSRDEESTDP